MIIVGDRRGAVPVTTGPGAGWSETVSELVVRLQADLGALVGA